MFHPRGGGSSRFDGGRSRLLSVYGLRVALLRDFVFGRQRLVPVHVILSPQVIRFGLPQKGLRGFKLSLGGRQACLGILHIGLGA